ncbi:uncharacterized protein BJ212DRAFT_1485463 [Suillus subaureus]|uniref:Fungal-type protein kinase domain-containing protein n=1 Tax=Suillus subaureus TaxID=48587 RepID=A0A9P7E048_9AGAM|nr:uncharacterized protein BJ212DRAFT_1485463 [Suillus subaureus]KAG1807618.1 hypothetical protein BJ212DRAFT_1485463 [Suillus subaureus]
MQEQPWCHFIILFSIANLQLRAHYMDRSGMIISQPLPIGANAMRFVDVLNTITLSDLASLGFDPTIHICTNLCSTGSHNDLPEGIDQMLEGTKGWVMDNDAHKAMVTQQNILHGDLSPNNLIIHDGKAYFIDFNHAKFLKTNAAVNLCGTGTVPYISCCLLKLMGDVPCPSTIDHRASDDLESLFYILLEFTTTYEGPSGKTSAEGVHPVNAPRWCKAYLMMDGDGLGTSGSLKKEFLTEKHPPYKPTPYFKACCPILEEWRKAIGDALHNECDLSHKEILKIMQQGLERILSIPGTPTLQSVVFLPATSVATPSPTSLPLPTHPHHPISLPPASLPPPHIEAMAQDAGVQPHHSGWQTQMLPPELPSVTQGTIAHSASGSMTSQFHSSSSPPTSG